MFLKALPHLSGQDKHICGTFKSTSHHHDGSFGVPKLINRISVADGDIAIPCIEQGCLSEAAGDLYDITDIPPHPKAVLLQLTLVTRLPWDSKDKHMHLVTVMLIFHWLMWVMHIYILLKSFKAKSTKGTSGTSALADIKCSYLLENYFESLIQSDQMFLTT